MYQNIKSEDNILLLKSLKTIVDYWQYLDIVYSDNKKKFSEIFFEFREKEAFGLKNKIDEFVDVLSNILINPLKNSFGYDLDFYLKEVRVNLVRKMTRMRKIELEKGILTDEDVDLNILTALKSSFYMYFRQLYNQRVFYKIDTFKFSSIYYFIRNYTYSGMFRYNSNREFNVPYGGIGYNNNSLNKKIEYISSEPMQEKLKNTTIECGDFYDFFANKNLTKNDFIFLDPPYDTEFSTYDQNEFDANDQERLANFLINEAKCNWMVVIKNTPFIHSIYNKFGINIVYFDKSYNVSFMNRNNKDTEHLMITNY